MWFICVCLYPSKYFHPLHCLQIKPHALWSAINHDARFYRLSAYLFLFNRFKYQELASDIKQLLLDGRNTAVAMAIVLSPFFFLCNFSLLCFFCTSPFHQFFSYMFPFFFFFSFSFQFTFCVDIIAARVHLMHVLPHMFTNTCWISAGHLHYK